MWPYLLIQMFKMQFDSLHSAWKYASNDMMVLFLKSIIFIILVTCGVTHPPEGTPGAACPFPPLATPLQST